MHFFAIDKKVHFFEYKFLHFDKYFKNDGNYLELNENIAQDIIFTGIRNRKNCWRLQLSIQNTDTGRKEKMKRKVISVLLSLGMISALVTAW